MPSHEGMLEHIFRRVSIKVKKATDSTIVYEIKAPDMRNVFTDIDAEDISEDELLEHIKSYAKTRKQRQQPCLLRISLWMMRLW